MKETPCCPASPKQQEITKMIEDRIRPILGEDVSVYFQRPFTMYTFAVRTITSMIDILGDISRRYGIMTIEIFPQIIANLSAKEADAEKDGNLNVSFEMPKDIRVHVEDMHEFLADIRKQNGDEVKVLKLKNPNDKNEEMIVQRINSETIKDLQDKHAIMVMDTDLPITIAAYYLAGMYDVLGNLARETGHLIMYNLGDVIEVSCIIRKDEPFYRIQPGVCAKLTIKQDSFTEEA